VVDRSEIVNLSDETDFHLPETARLLGLSKIRETIRRATLTSHVRGERPATDHPRQNPPFRMALPWLQHLLEEASVEAAAEGTSSSEEGAAAGEGWMIVTFSGANGLRHRPDGAETCRATNESPNEGMTGASSVGKMIDDRSGPSVSEISTAHAANSLRQEWRLDSRSIHSTVARRRTSNPLQHR